MVGVQAFDFDSPDETRSPEKTRVDVVRIGGTTAGRFAFEPGWRWSECIQPLAGTDSCQARHVGVVQSGTLRVAHEDGSEVDLRAGDAYVIEPGHDAWVVPRLSPPEHQWRERKHRRTGDRGDDCRRIDTLTTGSTLHNELTAVGLTLVAVATADEAWAHLRGDVANRVHDVRRSIPLRGTARVRLPLLRL